MEKAKRLKAERESSSASEASFTPTMVSKRTSSGILSSTSNASITSSFQRKLSEHEDSLGSLSNASLAHIVIIIYLVTLFIRWHAGL